MLENLIVKRTQPCFVTKPSQQGSSHFGRGLGCKQRHLERHDSWSLASSQANGRKQGRRIGRKLSSSSHKQRSHPNDLAMRENLPIMPKKNVLKPTDDEDANSYECYNSKDLCNNPRRSTFDDREEPNSVSQTGRRTASSLKSNCESECSSEMNNMCTSTMYVTDQRRTHPIGETGVYTGSVYMSMGAPHGHQGRFNYDKPVGFYDGGWRYGCLYGNGILGNSRGDIYQGRSKNDLKHGIGTMCFADGRKFQGRNILGELREGSMTYADGSTYKGEIRAGVPHGSGRSCLPGGSWYEGRFRSGKQHGRDAMHWADGAVYEGDLRNGKITGFGKEYRSDGSLCHEGLFRDGRLLRNQESARCVYCLVGHPLSQFHQNIILVAVYYLTSFFTIWNVEDY